MEDPVSEIPSIINTLCTARPSVQLECIETYFSPTASFTHPFCRTGTFDHSRRLIVQIYRWYKILSPRTDVSVDSVAFDEANLLLYVSIRQIFKIPIIPFYEAKVALVTVLSLVEESSSSAKSGVTDQSESQLSGKPFFRSSTEASLWSSPASSASAAVTSQPILDPRKTKKRYFIQSQNDLYQTTEWIKFVVPWGVGTTILLFAQFWATFFCVLGATLGWPLTWLRENDDRGNLEE